MHFVKCIVNNFLLDKKTTPTNSQIPLKEGVLMSSKGHMLGEKKCHRAPKRLERSNQESRNYRNETFAFFSFCVPNLSTFARRLLLTLIRLQRPC
jgi:hypothetical protein